MLINAKMWISWPNTLQYQISGGTLTDFGKNATQGRFLGPPLKFFRKFTILKFGNQIKMFHGKSRIFILLYFLLISLFYFDSYIVIRYNPVYIFIIKLGVYFICRPISDGWIVLICKKFREYNGLFTIFS